MISLYIYHIVVIMKWSAKWDFSGDTSVKELICQFRRRKRIQSILKEISPEYSLEGLMLKLKLEYFGHLMQATEKTEGTRRKEWQDEMVGWHHWVDGHEFKQAPGIAYDREAWLYAVHGITKSQTRLNNWTDWLKTLGFSHWVGRIFWRGAWQLTPGFWLYSCLENPME